MNQKSIKERAQILHCLVEGNSIRSTARITNSNKNTVLKLLVEAGEACLEYHDTRVKNVKCDRVQVDEIWSYVYSKRRNTPEGKDNAGDIWTWTGLDPDSKFMVSYAVGKRDAETALEFTKDLKSRLASRVQLTSDGLNLYLDAVEEAFVGDIDYGMIKKIYGKDDDGRETVNSAQNTVVGHPDEGHISTSLVERQNLTMRMSMRRFTRKTNAFSKKVYNHICAIALHFTYYNFARVHSTIKTTPAIAIGLTDKVMTLEDIAQMAEDYKNIKSPV